MRIRRRCGPAPGLPSETGGAGATDIAVTIETPEGDPGLMLTEIAAVEGGILVVGNVGKERGQPMRHLVHGSVSCCCCEYPRCAVVAVPPAEGAGR